MAEHIQISDVSPRVQYAGDSTQTVFTYPFPIFDAVDLKVYEDAVLKTLTTDYSVDGAGNSSGGTVTFVAPPPINSTVTLLRNLPVLRTSDFQESGEFRAQVLNDELDKQIAMLQQVDENVRRAVPLPVTALSNVDLSLPEPEADRLLRWNGDADGLVNGPTTADMYSTVVNKTVADSPLIPTANDNGTLFVIDTTGGTVLVTMPDIDTVGEAYRIGVLKDDGGVNTITINGSGGDTLNGSSTYVVANSREMANLVADERGGQDDQAVFGGGVSAGNRSTETFADGVDYTSGTTTQLTLANDYGAADNIDVLFDGQDQHRNTYTLSGTALTFSGAIPLGTTEVHVTGGHTQPIAVPTDNSVTTAKITAGAVTDAKLADTVIDDLTAETAPPGFLICDGSQVSRTTYAALFAVIGTTYGVGDGSTTFNVPDFRGRVPGGVNNAGLPNGANGSYSTRNLADATGAEAHTLTESEMPSHGHSYTHVPSGSSGASGGGGISNSSLGATTGAAGNNGSHNNMQPTLFANFIISTG